nr:heavy metal-associated isoprenylated plant protein 2-like [Coffea arabica]
MKKTEVKVNINCHKCKSEVLKAVTKLQGIDQVTADAAKGILTVVGEVDPVCVITRVRKTGKDAEIISVGPPKNLIPLSLKSQIMIHQSLFPFLVHNANMLLSAMLPMMAEFAPFFNN